MIQEQPEFFFRNPDICHHYHGGDPESVAANEDSIPRKKRDRLRIMGFLKNRGKEGATCDETEVLLDMRHQTCSARFTELKADDEIAKIGLRPTRSGNQAGVYVVTEERHAHNP